MRPTKTKRTSVIIAGHPTHLSEPTRRFVRGLLVLMLALGSLIALSTQGQTNYTVRKITSAGVVTFTARKMPLNWRFTVGPKGYGSSVSQGPITSAFRITNALNTLTRDGCRWIVDAHKAANATSLAQNRRSADPRRIRQFLCPNLSEKPSRVRDRVVTEATGQTTAASIWFPMVAIWSPVIGRSSSRASACPDLK